LTGQTQAWQSLAQPSLFPPLIVTTDLKI
jgi:hypothetical protein